MIAKLEEGNGVSKLWKQDVISLTIDTREYQQCLFLIIAVRNIICITYNQMLDCFPFEAFTEILVHIYS